MDYLANRKIIIFILPASCLFGQGIFERWNQTVESFHARFGGRLFSDELLAQRSAKAGTQQQRRALERIIRQHSGGGGGPDPFDTDLYSYAKQLYAAQLQQLPQLLLQQ